MGIGIVVTQVFTFVKTFGTAHLKSAFILCQSYLSKKKKK